MIEGQHPFMLSFCHGADIHDVFTGINVPEQEELMFVFPVSYNDHFCSYIPVLYLDSLMGVVGGLYYGLRKEWHPEMKVEETEDSKSWHIRKIIDASFKQKDETEPALPQFISQTFENPFITVSYLDETYFYQAKVYESLVKESDVDYTWDYKGSELKNRDDTMSVYSEYHFTMSKPMSYKAYFGN